MFQNFLNYLKIKEYQVNNIYTYKLYFTLLKNYLIVNVTK